MQTLISFVALVVLQLEGITILLDVLQTIAIIFLISATGMRIFAVVVVVVIELALIVVVVVVVCAVIVVVIVLNWRLAQMVAVEVIFGEVEFARCT